MVLVECVRARVPLRLWHGAVPAVGRGVCGVPLPAGLTEGSRLPEPIFTPPQGGDRRARRDHRLHPRSPIVGETGAEGAAALPIDVDGRTPANQSASAGRPRRHQVRVRPPAGGRGGPGRRGADPGLLAILAGRPLRARARASRPSTSSTCATGSTPPPAGTARLRAPPSFPTKSSPGPVPSTSRPTSASPASPGPDRTRQGVPRPPRRRPRIDPQRRPGGGGAQRADVRRRCRRATRIRVVLVRAVRGPPTTRAQRAWAGPPAPLPWPTARPPHRWPQLLPPCTRRACGRPGPHARPAGRLPTSTTC